MKQIKASEIAKYRNHLAGKQKYRCGICKAPLAGQVITLDHSHVDGRLRGALCNTCNRSEGKVKKAAQYMAKVTHLSKTDYLGFLKELVRYLEYFHENPRELYHPTFDLKTGKQKPVKRKKRTKSTK